MLWTESSDLSKDQQDAVNEVKVETQFRHRPGELSKPPESPEVIAVNVARIARINLLSHLALSWTAA